jgi:type IV pilus assembly protein PilM
MAFDFSSLVEVFSFGSDVHLGIDVGASSVKIVALKANGSKSPKIVGIGYSDTPMGCVIDGQLSDTRSMNEVLRGILERQNIKYKKQNANVGLRGLNVVFKRLVLPYQRPEEMAQQVILEAQQQVDSDLADWVIDFQVLGTPDAEGQVAVMLVAAKRAAVDEYDNLLKLVGVIPAVFDCDVFAIENCYEHCYGKNSDTVMCVDVGKDSTKINIIQEGTPILVRSISMGGHHLTELIQKNLGIDMDSAEKTKLAANDSGDLMKGELSTSVHAHVEEMCDELKKTLDFFSSAATGVKVDTFDRVVLSGGGSAIGPLSASIGKFLNCEVVHSNPFEKLSVPGRFKDLVVKFPHVFSVAVGLALRRVGDKPK